MVIFKRILTFKVNDNWIKTKEIWVFDCFSYEFMEIFSSLHFYLLLITFIHNNSTPFINRTLPTYCFNNMIWICIHLSSLFIINVVLYNTYNLWSKSFWFYQTLTGAGGVCFNCKIIERIRDTSLEVRDDLGLKSHSFAIRSHSVPGSTSSASATNCFSAFLLIRTPNYL